MKLLFILLSLLFSFQVFAQTPEDLQKAKQLYDEAGRAYKLEDYEVALQKYKESYILSGRPALLFNIAQCQRLLGRNEDAVKNYQLYLQEEPETPYRKDVEEHIKNLKSLTAPNEPPKTASQPVETKIDPPNPPIIPTPVVTPIEPKTEPALKVDEKPTTKYSMTPMYISGGLLVAGLALGAGALSVKNKIEQEGRTLELQKQRFRLAALSDIFIATATINFAVTRIQWASKKSIALQLSPNLSPALTVYEMNLP